MPEGSDEHLTSRFTALVAEAAELTRLEPDDLVIQRDTVADRIHFLIDGTVRHVPTVGDPANGEVVSAEDIAWLPVGWSSMQFPRYRGDVVAATPSRFLSVDIGAGRRLASQQPALWALLSEFMLRSVVPMLWMARRRPIPTVAEHPAVVAEGLDLVPDVDQDSLAVSFGRSPTLAGLPADCRQWLAENCSVYHGEGNVVVLREGEPTGGMWLLESGRVSLRFEVGGPDGERTAVRQRVRPGSLLGWSVVDDDLPAPYTVETTRNSTLVFVPREALAELRRHEPRWLGDLLQLQLWTLRYFMLSTWTENVEGESDGGIDSVAGLIEEHMPVLPVDSGLLGVPHLLADKLTRENGFRQLYRAFHVGTSAERVLARLAIDLLRDLERGHRFYQGMLATYSVVVSNRHLEPRRLRGISSRYFRQALTQVPYVIKGIENLPDDANCVLIYNHMAYAEDSVLPNGFLFNPDTHFVSSVLMEPKYGDGIRIARSNDATEYWRAQYYEPQEHIAVVTPESGWVDETPEEKEQRKERFFADCAAVLADGRPFGIAPEGNITEEESTTEQSPAHFKPGAFIMSQRLPSKPKLVPVAFANLDKPAHRAVFSCVIKPAFSMDDRGIDVDDREAMSRFLDEYRREFRGYVEEAVDLARHAVGSGADLNSLVTNLGTVSVVNEEFEHEVREMEIRQTPLRHGPNPTVFFGSSTFRLWNDGLGPAVGLPDAVNLGFGGATMEAGRHYFERMVLPYRPSRLIVYFGENDLAAGHPIGDVVDRFRELAEAVDLTLPEAECWFVSNKPSPARRDRQGDIIRVNQEIRAEIDGLKQWRFIDWFGHMVDDDGEPRAELYGPDQLHLNADGYDVLAGLLRRKLGVGG